MMIMRIYLSLWCRWSRTGSYRSITSGWACTELREPSSLYATLVDGRTSHADLEHWASSVASSWFYGSWEAGGLSGLAVSNAAPLIYRVLRRVSWYFCYITLAVVLDVLRSRALVWVLKAALSLLSSTLQSFIDPQCATICKCRSPSTLLYDLLKLSTWCVLEVQCGLYCELKRCICRIVPGFCIVSNMKVTAMEEEKKL
jgi:hypothetical protein